MGLFAPAPLVACTVRVCHPLVRADVGIVNAPAVVAVTAAPSRVTV